MTNIDTKGWAERFDELFDFDMCEDCGSFKTGKTTNKAIKSFVSSLLSTDRTQLAERVEKLRKNATEDQEEGRDWDDGYDQALDEVLAIINEPTDA